MEESMKNDLLKSYAESSIRGLKQSSKWSSEMLFALEMARDNDNDEDANAQMVNVETLDRPLSRSDCGTPINISVINHCENYDPKFLMAKCCFDLGEYDRCAHFTRDAQTRESPFLHFYSLYLSAEKKRLDTMAETNYMNSDTSLKLFSELRNELQQLLSKNKAMSEDSYVLYVYAIVLLKLELNWEARDVLASSVCLSPLNWSSWHQLSLIIDDKTQLEHMELPSHWFKKFFTGAVYLELQMNEEALQIYANLLETFKSSNYILSQMAIAKNNLLDVDGAIELFRTIRESDPSRLDSMDIYSNLLYVKEMRTELSSLAHAANTIDPFRVETCCCIANFYSLRSQPAKAVVYYSRALQLNPRHLSAWTLMGHEYMEMKNTGAAIQAYRSAIKCNKRDFRAWYGLGQTYEILKMPAYSLYYYSVAHCLCPNDSRMIIATGETLEKLERNSDALRCYWKAGGVALFKLASLYERLHEHDKAAAAYADYIRSAIGGISDTTQLTGSADLSHAYKFLANYHLTRSEFKLAQNSAQKCTQFPETRDEGKHLLKEIQKKSSFIG